MNDLDALTRLGAKIDRQTLNENRQGLLESLRAVDDALGSDPWRKAVHPQLHYFASNIHAALGTIAAGGKPDEVWSWNQEAALAQIASLRRAIRAEGFAHADPIFRAQVHTNLGNALSGIGRPIAALEAWRAALDAVPRFGIAWGNAASGALWYAEAFYDAGHVGLAALQVRAELTALLDGSRPVVWDSPHPLAEVSFARRLERANEVWEACGSPDGEVDDIPLGPSAALRDYHRWCLEERLYLNPLNDVMTGIAASRDVLHLPNHTYKVGEEPRFPRYYDLLKQEYVAARWRLYEGMIADETTHDVGSEGVLYLGESATCLTYGADQLRVALRSAYALLDKVAVFIADYYRLEISVGGISASKVWLSSGSRRGAPMLRNEFEGNRNWLLRGLYYLCRDLFDERLEAADPDARRVYELRRQAEHRFLALTHFETMEADTDAFVRVTKSEMIEHAMKAVRLAREAVIYLPLIMRREEALREEVAGDGLVMPMVSSGPVGP